MTASSTQHDRAATVLLVNSGAFATLSRPASARALRRDHFAPVLTLMNLATWAWAAWSGGLALG